MSDWVIVKKPSYMVGRQLLYRHCQDREYRNGHKVLFYNGIIRQPSYKNSHTLVMHGKLYIFHTETIRFHAGVVRYCMYVPSLHTSIVGQTWSELYKKIMYRYLS